MFEDKIIVYVNTCNNPYTKQECEKYLQTCREKNLQCKYHIFHNITDVFPKLSDPNFSVDIITIDVEHLMSYDYENPYSLISTLKTLSNSTVYRNKKSKSTIKRSIKIIGCVKTSTSNSIIKELMPFVDGLCIGVSEKWTTNMVVADQIKLLNGDYSIPKEIQQKLKLRKDKEDIKDNNKLTPRQKQVLLLVVKRGATNKVIAKTLKISESTVKLHVGSILKKYGLRNRTQLAFFMKDYI